MTSTFLRRSIFIAALLGALASSAVAVATSNTTVTTHKTSRGKVLANSRGFTLYVFVKDTEGGKGKSAKSTCNGKCANTWPPLLVKNGGKAVSAGGVNQKLLGTARRTDESTQVTYNGWPLYTNMSDPKAGTIVGEGVAQFGGRWYLLKTKGQEVTGCPPGYRMTPSGCLTQRY
jgi:predicted lipoprotein with Yx(FWY)xxD motif